ncbi:MAG: hypothetical protein ACHQU0_02060 [Candidatus Paceibacteria bacterium]
MSNKKSKDVSMVLQAKKIKGCSLFNLFQFALPPKTDVGTIMTTVEQFNHFRYGHVEKLPAGYAIESCVLDFSRGVVEAAQRARPSKKELQGKNLPNHRPIDFRSASA